MDWVAFTRACLPYVEEARRRHPKPAPVVEPERKKLATDICPQGHEPSWYYYTNRFGYACRYCRTCRQIKRRARSK